MMLSSCILSLMLFSTITTQPFIHADETLTSVVQEQTLPASPFPVADQMTEQKTVAPSFQALFAKTMVLVFFLLALATGALILLKKTQNKFFKTQNQGDIAIVEKRALSPKTQLFLVSIKGKELLLVESAHTITITPIASTVEPKELS